MKRLIIGAALLLASFAGHAQDTIRTSAHAAEADRAFESRQTTVALKSSAEEGGNVSVVATGARAPRRPSAHPKAAHQYTTGPRGGCYYISSSGKKVYVTIATASRA